MIGFFSPLPPARTGVADYAAALLAGLRAHGRVEVAPEQCEVALYHIGNNGLHADFYRRALEHPGITVLHDAVLHHFLLGQLGREAYITEFTYNYGEWTRGLAEDLWKKRAGSGSDSRYFDYPMLRRIAERSRAIIVHNPAAARAVAAHAPEARIVEIPHLFAPPSLPSTAEALRYRQQIGASPAAFLFGVFGYLRESKRITTILDCFLKLRRTTDRIMLLIAGEFVSTDLERAVEPLLRAPGVIRLPYLPEKEFWLAASAVDACINLRYPAAGETSGISIRLMGIGKPIILTDAPECSRYPEDGCIRIAAGAAEKDSILQHMLLLTSMNEVARAVGQRGAGHIQEHHRVEEISDRYWKLLCEYWA